MNLLMNLRVEMALLSELFQRLRNVGLLSSEMSAHSV